MPKIYVIHENAAWVEPLRAAFAELHLPFEEWFLSEGLLDLAAVPPEGVFYNRMSASSHTRGHRFAAEYTGGVLAWLESRRRRVINNGRALQLEVSKIAQYAALANYGIRTPRTLAAVGRANLVAAARQMTGPFITKHNRAGKGLGVRLFNSVEALERHVDSDAFEDSIDGVTLIQEYIQAPEPYITRVEFVGGRFFMRCASIRRLVLSCVRRMCARSVMRSARQARRWMRKRRRAQPSRRRRDSGS